MNKVEIGMKWEEIAERELENHGFQILESHSKKNVKYNSTYDILAEKENSKYAIDVKNGIINFGINSIGLDKLSNFEDTIPCLFFINEHYHCLFTMDFKKNKKTQRIDRIEKIPLHCKNCGNEWNYGGNQRYYAKCNDCLRIVRITKEEPI